MQDSIAPVTDLNNPELEIKGNFIGLWKKSNVTSLPMYISDIVEINFG